jgi:hypothetical protein
LVENLLAENLLVENLLVEQVEGVHWLNVKRLSEYDSIVAPNSRAACLCSNLDLLRRNDIDFRRVDMRWT